MSDECMVSASSGGGGESSRDAASQGVRNSMRCW